MARKLLVGNFSWQALFEAIKNGDCETVQHALSNGWDFRIPLKSTCNGLELAAILDQSAVIDVIISSEQMSRFSKEEKARLLTFSVLEACKKAQVSSVEKLLGHVNDMQLRETFDSVKVRDAVFESTYIGGSLELMLKLESYYGRTEPAPVRVTDYQLGRRDLLAHDVEKFRARNQEIVQFIGDENMTCRIEKLHVACALGDVQTVQEEIEKNEDWVVMDDGTALHSPFCIAAQYGNVNVLDLLVKNIIRTRPAYFDLDLQIIKVCDAACRQGHIPVIEWILENFPCQGSFSTAWEKRLDSAAVRGDLTTVTFIYEHFIRVQLSRTRVADILRKHLRSTLNKVCSDAHPDLNTVAYLMKLVDIDWGSDLPRDNILNRSVEGGLELISFLLENGASFECEHSSENTAVSSHRFLNDLFSGKGGRRCQLPHLIEMILGRLGGATCQCGYIKPLQLFLGQRSSYMSDTDTPFDVIVSNIHAILRIFFKAGIVIDNKSVADAFKSVLSDGHFLESVMAAKLVALAEWVDFGELLEMSEIQWGASNIFSILECQCEPQLDRDVMLRDLFIAMSGTGMRIYTCEGFYKFLAQPPTDRYRQLWNCVRQCGVSIVDGRSQAPVVISTWKSGNNVELEEFGRTAFEEIKRLGDESTFRNLSLRSLCRLQILKHIRSTFVGPKSDRIQAMQSLLPRALVDFLSFHDVLDKWEPKESPPLRFNSLGTDERHLITGMILGQFFGRDGIFGPDFHGGDDYADEDDDDDDYDDFDDYDDYDDYDGGWVDEDETEQFG